MLTDWTDESLKAFGRHIMNCYVRVKKNDRCVILAGAPIGDYERVKGYLQETDYVVCCDSGYQHCCQLGIEPDLIIGDFDSLQVSISKAPIIQLPREKDDTDTFFAIKEMVKRGFTQMLLLGCIGGRFDHSLINISVLLYLNSNGVTAKLIDDYSEMEIVDGDEAIVDSHFSYFSIISVAGTASGVYIENAKYPLEDAVIEPEFQYGISNEVIEGRTSRISVRNGKLLLVKVF